MFGVKLRSEHLLFYSYISDKPIWKSNLYKYVNKPKNAATKIVASVKIVQTESNENCFDFRGAANPMQRYNLAQAMSRFELVFGIVI